MNYQKGNALIVVIVLIALVAGYFYFAGDEDAGEKMTQEYTLTINNISETQPLSPGVFVVHTTEASLDFESSLAPSELEPLAEYGSHEALAELAEQTRGILQVIRIDSPILPGESTEVSFMTEENNLFLSGIMMAVASNDGYALLNGLELDGGDKIVKTANFDAGTEENEELGSGFDGGQPDPSRGEENIENGTPTDPQEPVSAHPQLTDSIMEVVVKAVVMEEDEGMEEEGGEEN